MVIKVVREIIHFLDQVALHIAQVHILVQQVEWDVDRVAVSEVVVAEEDADEIMYWKLKGYEKDI